VFLLVLSPSGFRQAGLPSLKLRQAGIMAGCFLVEAIVFINKIIVDFMVLGKYFENTIFIRSHHGGVPDYVGKHDSSVPVTLHGYFRLNYE
jgi:hypothetical protein